MERQIENRAESRGRAATGWLRALITLCVVVVLTSLTPIKGQNVVGITGGFGSSSDALYPMVESRATYGLPNFGVSWRNYSETNYVGCFGIDIEYMKRGFSYALNSSYADSKADYLYYNRTINTILVPIVWQPYVYMLYRRVRLFAEAAVTFSYDFSSEYENEYAAAYYGDDTVTEGEYEYLLARDNRLGYGLAFGGGIAVLIGRYEIMSRVRYYWGLSDVVRNRNKYYSNNLDGAENPFSLSPIRSSLNGMMFNIGVAYRFDPEGFKVWRVKREKAPKMGRDFNYQGTR